MTEEEKIEEFLNRGVESIYPNKEFVREQLLSGKKLTMYLGIDPTGPSLHLGHATALKKMSEFQKLGHTPILLIGSFTGRIGDPTGKSTTRATLTQEQVRTNARLYKKQASTFLSFGWWSGAKIKENSTWLKKMNLDTFLSIAHHLTVEQLQKRDLFVQRRNAGGAVFLHEFLYPVLQGYDSVAMDIDGEVGGNDQIFNMLIGRDLTKAMKGKEKFVISLKLLTDNTGKKMGKTEGNMVTLSDEPKDMYGKIMSWDDSLIIPGFELCTNISLTEIKDIQASLEKGTKNPRDMKMRLAHKIVSLYHSTRAAQKAQDTFVNVFQKREVGEEEIQKIQKRGNITQTLVEEGIIPSKKELQRLLESGAVRNVHTNQKYNSAEDIPINKDIKIGKRTFIRIIE